MPLPEDAGQAAQWAIQQIEASLARYDIVLGADSVLARLLHETRQFQQSARDLAELATAAATDEASVLVASPLLRTFRLATALELHLGEGTPELRRAFEPLVAFQDDTDEHRSQFDEAEYEVHSASQFVGLGKRVSFVNPDHPSRYRKRVEFMLGYKFPVECKRPRARARIAPITAEAADKINERNQPGVVCVALENALPSTADFREVSSLANLRHEVSRDFDSFWKEKGAECEGAFRGGAVRFILFNYSGLVYYHDTERAGFPSLRMCRTRDGRWLTNNVTAAIVDGLAAVGAPPIG